MNIRNNTLALGLVLVLGASGIGVALAQDMPDSQPGQGSGMMGGGQGSMGPDMMEGMMVGGQSGMGPGMMDGMMAGGMMPCPMMGGDGMGMMQ